MTASLNDNKRTSRKFESSFDHQANLKLVSKSSTMKKLSPYVCACTQVKEGEADSCRVHWMAMMSSEPRH